MRCILFCLVFGLMALSALAYPFVATDGNVIEVVEVAAPEEQPELVRTARSPHFGFGRRGYGGYGGGYHRPRPYGGYGGGYGRPYGGGGFGGSNSYANAGSSSFGGGFGGGSSSYANAGSNSYGGGFYG